MLSVQDSLIPKSQEQGMLFAINVVFMNVGLCRCSRRRIDDLLSFGFRLSRDISFAAFPARALAAIPTGIKNLYYFTLGSPNAHRVICRLCPGCRVVVQ